MPTRARENLDVASLGLVYSQSVLLALVDHGLARDDAYRIVQRAAADGRRATRRAFREVLEDDAEVRPRRDELDEAFDLDRLLRTARGYLDAIERL